MKFALPSDGDWIGAFHVPSVYIPLLLCTQHNASGKRVIYLAHLDSLWLVKIKSQLDFNLKESLYSFAAGKSTFNPLSLLRFYTINTINFWFGFGKSRAKRISKEHTDFYWETLFCTYVNKCTEINVMQNILIVT